MASSGKIVMAIGIGLMMLSCCTSESNIAQISQMVAKRQSVGDNCVALATSKGLISYPCRQALVDAAKTNNTVALTAAVCSSLCDSLYKVFVDCYGAAEAQKAYKTDCANGYNGAAVQATFNYSIVLVSAIIVLAMFLVE